MITSKICSICKEEFYFKVFPSTIPGRRKYCSFECRNKALIKPIRGGMKECSHCKKEKPTSEFTRSLYRSDGLLSWCKECYRTRKNQFIVIDA